MKAGFDLFLLKAPTRRPFLGLMFFILLGLLEGKSKEVVRYGGFLVQLTFVKDLVIWNITYWYIVGFCKTAASDAVH